METESLYEACKKNDVKSVHDLIKAGADLEPTSDKPLHIAIKLKHKEIVSMLIAAGASTEAKDANGLPSIHLAAENGDVEILKMIIAATEDIDIITDNGCTAVYHSLFASKNKFQVIETLIRAGASTDILTQKGFSCLHYAVFYNTPEVVDLLLRSGAAVNIYTPKYVTPAYLAVGGERFEMVQLLYDAGADFEHISAQIQRPPTYEMLNFFHAIGASVDLNIADFSVFKSPFLPKVTPSATTLLKQPTLLKELIQKGLNPNTRESSGRTLLHDAVVQKDMQALRTLIYAGANANTRDIAGRSPLDSALSSDESLSSTFFSQAMQT